MAKKPNPKKDQVDEAAATDQPEAESVVVNEAVAGGSAASDEPAAPEPTDADVSEQVEPEAAEVAPEPTEEVLVAKKGIVTFISTRDEPHSFEIQVVGTKYRGTRDRTGKKLLFEIPEEHVDRFKMHHHYKHGRVTELKV